MVKKGLNNIKFKLVVIVAVMMLFFAACSNQTPEISQTPDDSAEPSHGEEAASSGYERFYSEEEFAERLLESRFAFTYYYKPANISSYEYLKLKYVDFRESTITFVYTTDELENYFEKHGIRPFVLEFVWRYAEPGGVEPDGGLRLQNAVDRLGWEYVYPDYPAEGAKYVSDLNWDEAKAEGRWTWDVYYSVNRVSFSATVPWDVDYEDISKYLAWEKVTLKW